MANLGLKKTEICCNYRQNALSFLLPKTVICCFFFYQVSNTIRVIQVDNLSYETFVKEKCLESLLVGDWKPTKGSLTISLSKSAVLGNTEQRSEVQCSAGQYSAVQCTAMHYSVVQCSAVHCSAVQFSAMQFSTEQCSTVRVVQYIDV